MKLRYVELKPERIFNWLGPENVTAKSNLPHLRDKWWSDEAIEQRNLFAKLWTEEFDKITNHFTALEQSIVKEGIKTPVNLISGPLRSQDLSKVSDTNEGLPPEYQDNPENALYTRAFGGSRVTIAKKHNITVPCVVHDFSNLFPDAPEITKNNFKDWFGDNYIFTPAKPHIRLRYHTHLDGKYDRMNNSTRKAQREAAKRALKRMGLND